MRAWPALVLMLLLAGCARSPVRPPGESGDLAAQAAREAALASEGSWGFSGRLSVDAAGEGGSGRIQWRQRGQDFEIQLSAPVTRKSWQLSQRQGAATLAGVEGGTRHGVDAGDLLRQATGWELPVEALAAWARGARAEGPAQLVFGPSGLPQSLQQKGWLVEYREWDDARPPRPRRVFARRGEASVRLVVDQWEVP